MKVNIVKQNFRSAPECTTCGYRFDTSYAVNPYHEMLEIAYGKYKFCPHCGDKYEGMLVEGKPISEHSSNVQSWASIYNIRGLR